MGQIIQMMTNLEEEDLLAEVKRNLETGENPLALLEACRKGMSEIGKLFERGDYFLSELIMAGEIFKQVSAIVTPRLAEGNVVAPKGKVVMGTVKDDIHDVGKDIVVTILRGANYEVEDLGVDVPPERFVEATKKTGAGIVGMSGLMTFAFDSMKQTIALLKQAGLPVKVMIGGGTVTEQICKQVGADAMGMDAQAAVSLCDRWVRDEGMI